MNDGYQQIAEVDLLLNREIDKRVWVAIIRALAPYDTYGVSDMEQAFDRKDTHQIRTYAIACLITAIMQDGSLMHMVRTKLAEQMAK